MITSNGRLAQGCIRKNIFTVIQIDMVVKTISYEKIYHDPKGQRRPQFRQFVRVVMDEEIRSNSEFCKNLERTASGGVKFHLIEWDEFDNKFETIIIIEGPELQTIKDLVEKGLI